MKFLLSLTLALAVVAPTAHAQSPQKNEATASFQNMAGEDNGLAELTQTADGVLIDIEVSGLPPSRWIAFHVHENGRCDPASKYDSAGGHFNPGGADHGYLAENAPHAGDMPNQYVGHDGILRAQVFNAEVTLDDSNAIRGKALVIHGDKDDYESQPSGDAGSRQACAVIE